MDNTQRGIAAAVGALTVALTWLPAAQADQPTYYEPPKFRIQVKPAYPASARVKHETGTVFVKVLVGADGVAKSITIARSSGHKDLDDEVLRVAKLSRYSPATRDGKATIAFYDFRYKFNLAGLEESIGAQGDLSRRLAADPRNVPARIALIDTQLTLNNYAQAESVADDGVKLLPSDARLWAERGRAYYNDGSANKNPAKLKTAADSYDHARKLDSKSVPASVVAAAYAEYAFSEREVGQWSACLPYAANAASLRPTEMKYRMLKADCEEGVDPKSGAALADYQAAQQLDDKKDARVSALLVASTGNAQLNMGNEAAGLSLLNQAQRIDPKAPFSYQYLATYYITKQNLNAALNPLLQLVQLQPNDTRARVNIGDIYVRQGNYTAAEAAYTKALTLDPKNADAQLGLAEILAAKGDLKSIDAPLQKAIAMAPGNASVYNSGIAQLLLQKTSDNVDHSADALKYADAATKADANNAMGWYTLGISYADQKKKDQANSALRKAYDLFKARNDQAGMTFVNQAYMNLNGKDSSLMTSGFGKNQPTPQPGSMGP
jgi:TonB family protein